jgi:hypothetical protein
VRIKALLLGTPEANLKRGAGNFARFFELDRAAGRDDSLLRGIVRTEYGIIRGERNGRAEETTLQQRELIQTFS